jgi:hypothetical protein
MDHTQVPLFTDTQLRKALPAVDRKTSSTSCCSA